MSYGCSRESRFKAAQFNFWMMRAGFSPLWQIVYLIEDEA